MPAPDKKCDLVMKGGITSGVVYPKAVLELSKTYVFQNIGGASAGAIAAVVTAAAEYGRADGGFEKIAALPDQLAADLLGKFQPRPEFRGLFALLLAALGRKPAPILWALLRGYWPRALIGAAPGAVILVFFGGDAGFALLGLLLAALGALCGAGHGAARQVARDQPQNDFGLCDGRTQPGADGPALTDWLTDFIDEVAGRPADAAPLTISDLAARGITVRTVTTDITTHRPYSLPMGNNLHAFSEMEFRRLFPARVVDHMIASSAKVGGWGGDPADLYYFQSEATPLVVLARMSLSFPGLISAVPLHRIDHTLIGAPENARVRRCLFSDGGVSSNFPVHFFDQLLPQTPTFGISLAVHDPLRVKDVAPGAGRVTLPTGAGAGRLMPTIPFSGLGGFVMAMFNSAKDWQDSLQSILPGYRERIVTVNLKPDEGGLNLTMAPETITRLGDLGEAAGAEIEAKFDLEEHRWRRYLIEMQALDTLLRRFAQNYDNQTPQPGARAYPDLALDYEPKSFTNLTKAERALIHGRAERVAALGREFEGMAPLADFARKLPSSKSALRNVALMD
ncbi:MAG: patatin-like phospholipase family protein [Paracoccaceae bacterium]